MCHDFVHSFHFFVIVLNIIGNISVIVGSLYCLVSSVSSPIFMFLLSIENGGWNGVPRRHGK